MKKENLIICLNARKEGIEETLRRRENRQQDFNSWRDFSTDELQGRLAEIKNTLDMLQEDC